MTQYDKRLVSKKELKTLCGIPYTPNTSDVSKRRANSPSGYSSGRIGSRGCCRRWMRGWASASLFAVCPLTIRLPFDGAGMAGVHNRPSLQL